MRHYGPCHHGMVVLLWACGSLFCKFKGYEYFGSRLLDVKDKDRVRVEIRLKSIALARIKGL